MKNIYLEGERLKSDYHRYLKEKFDFPDYYGENLDALYDCLTEIGIETLITTKIHMLILNWNNSPIFLILFKYNL